MLRLAHIRQFPQLLRLPPSHARQYGEEAQKGTLALGLRADFVILDRNPLCVPPQDLRTLQVLATYKDGEAVFAQGSAACSPAFRR